MVNNKTSLKQASKYHMSLAGEFFVAAQLQRRHVHACVTFGNAKGADVIALKQATGKAVIVEVKTSKVGRWLVGRRVPEASEQPWVFVDLPDFPAQPIYYVVTQSQLRSILKPLEDAYLARYSQRHGEEYGDKAGVATITRRLALPYQDQWQTILDQLK